MLSAAEERFQPLAERRDITLKIERPSMNMLVHADQERTAQVLANLVSNALNYSPAGSTVTLSALPEGSEVAILIRDQGAGLDEEQRERIFERFYRVDASRSRLGGGTGVGLTIARGLARAMGGDVQVTSEPNAGSVFRFSLPIPERSRTSLWRTSSA